MSCPISKMKKVGIELGAGTYATPSADFTRGLIVSAFANDPAQTVEPIAEVRGTLGIARVTKGPIGYAPTLSFPLDCGDGYGGCIGDFLGAVYGTETGTVVGAGYYKHVFTLLESCAVPYFNLVSDKDAVSKQITGFVPGSVKVTINAKEAQIPVEVTGISKDELDGYGTSNLVYSSANIVSGSMATAVNLAGAAVSSLETIDVTFVREQEALNYLTANTRTISEVVSGKSFSILMNATGIVFDDETERNKFKNVGTTSFDITLTEGSNYIKFYFPQMNYQTFAGPALGPADLLRVNFSAIVTGTASAHYVELVNQYDKKYTDGTTIS